MSKNQQMYLYEGMYILSSSLSEEARSKGLEKITSGIESRGGEIHKMHDMGRRKMAYEIQKRREGHFFLIYFSAPSSSIPELWGEYKLHEDLIRFMTLRTSKVLETIEFKALAQT